MKGWTIGVMAAAWVMLATMGSAYAQVAGGVNGPVGGGESMVTANGTVALPRRPDLMRLRVELSAEGKTIKDALAQMAERRKTVKQKLVELGAVESSIEFGDVKENAAGAANESPMARAMRMARGGRARPAPAKAAAKVVRVGATAKAHWQLKAENADDLLAQVHELQEKIRAADVGEAKKLSAEQQEEQEEAQVDFTGEPQAAPGEPVFLFVSKISFEEQSKALTTAFNKASVSAQQLAGAAGKQIGPLRQLSVMAGPGAEQYNQWQQYQMVFGTLQEAYGDGGLDEVAGPTVEGLKFRVVVTAAFALK